MLLKYYQKLDDAISYLFSSTANETKLLKKIFKKKKIVLVDIGANEGNFIDFLNKNFVLKKVFCFEPIKELSEKISQKYQSKNFSVSNIALSNKKDKKFFYQYYVTSTKLSKTPNWKLYRNVHIIFVCILFGILLRTKSKKR